MALTLTNMKPQLHPRNRHQVIDGVAYHFDELCKANPDLNPYVTTLDNQHKTINFSDPKAVKELNRALLLAYYKVDFWQLPDQFLCPPIPGRADYIHHLADLLAEDNQGQLPKGKRFKGIDIGTGANLVYPIIGRSEYQWSFVGSDVNPTSIQCAKTLIQSNRLLKSDVKLVSQSSPQHFFKGVIKADQEYAFSLCNPPFHKSAEEAAQGSQQKQKNLRRNQHLKQHKSSHGLNFGGQNSELWCPGGEVEFVCNMIEESVLYQHQVVWFSSLVAKKDSLTAIKAQLAKIKPAKIKIIQMGQGSKISRFVAWTFKTELERQQYFSQRRPT